MLPTCSQKVSTAENCFFRLITATHNGPRIGVLMNQQ